MNPYSEFPDRVNVCIDIIDTLSGKKDYLYKDLIWGNKELEEIFKLPKNKDGLTIRQDWEQNWKEKFYILRQVILSKL